MEKLVFNFESENHVPHNNNVLGSSEIPKHRLADSNESHCNLTAQLFTCHVCSFLPNTPLQFTCGSAHFLEILHTILKGHFSIIVNIYNNIWYLEKLYRKLSYKKIWLSMLPGNEITYGPLPYR